MNHYNDDREPRYDHEELTRQFNLGKDAGRAELLAILLKIHEAGCPTYRDNSASRTRNDAQCCWYCQAAVESESHAGTCVWRDVEAVVT